MKDFNVVHSDDIKSLPIATESLNFSLDEAYLSFDVRDSYLQRQAN